MIVHKRRNFSKKPKLSIILLDWSCREQFHALRWLNKQDVPRDEYEVIWVELYDRLIPEALEKADVVITCSQKGMYHKHLGYNVGLLEARGELINISDSDAVFPEEFVSSVFNEFYPQSQKEPNSLVLMHYEARTQAHYPESLTSQNELKQEHWNHWYGLHPNVGACMTVKASDAIRFGGFDEHKLFRGYMCGPYDLGWRLVNAGIPEKWFPYETMLWHFAHPDPTGAQGIVPGFAQLKELTNCHVDGHAWLAVEAFSSGRMLPLKENEQIHELRMARRVIGSEFEKKYAEIPTLNKFPNKIYYKEKIIILLNVALGSFAELGRKLTSKFLSVLKFNHNSAAQKDNPCNWRHRLVSDAVFEYLNYRFMIYNGLYLGFHDSIWHVRMNFIANNSICNAGLVIGEDLFAVQSLLDEMIAPNAEKPEVVYVRYKESNYDILVYRCFAYAVESRKKISIANYIFTAKTVKEVKDFLDNKIINLL